MTAQHPGSGDSVFTNRLIHETSPYLLQHAHNPVDWYPWGDEAFAKAKAEDKPVLLSVGYSACHWCHVMAHESFESEATAQLINDHYVAIKVDREERPDVDALYMDAVQALTGHGGWPMTVFLTPDGAPYYGGTYFPPEDRYGMPGFPTVLARLAEFYSSRRADVDHQAQAFREFYREQSARRIELPAGIDLVTPQVDPHILDDAADRLLAQIDAIHGGFGRAPKFPHPMGLDFLLRVEQRHREEGSGGTSDPQLLELVRLTLDSMAAGGIYDQVGGGFHRYSTDEHWLVPHFEKMLYDNALLARTYLAAWQLTGQARYQIICQEILDYVLREMTDAQGGFYATQDADSEGQEGKFYVWSRDDLLAALSESDMALAERLWGITARGNFEGSNILHVARTLADVAHELGLSEPNAKAALARIRGALYARRARRVWPGRDDKVIAAWNGLMLRAMADAARALERDDYRAAAEANATFLVDQLTVDGRLRRTWRQEQAKLDGYLEDYAAVANGLLATYEATGTTRWFLAARRLVDEMLERFWDEETESFFDSARDQRALIGRPRELTDNATPSGTSLAVECLLRLAAYTGESRYRERAARVLLALAPAAAEQPSAFGHLLCALDDLIGPLREIAIVGPATDARTRALVAVVNRHHLPRAVLALAAPEDRAAREAIPLLADRPLVNGLPTAYVCEHFACKLPTTEPGALAAQLGHAR
ncbi:MAG TPA: thioredoxin domain-containing protein [Ktedonobacterales bacterium]|nr:thioredoxin domain-containing protein [Ktedonobacterales bacterium]